MSFENRDHPPQAPPVYTVFPGHQENINYGFHGIYDSPPKYETVMRGDNSVWNNTPAAALPLQSESFVPKETKKLNQTKFWAILATLVFVIVFIYLYLKNNSDH